MVMRNLMLSVCVVAVASATGCATLSRGAADVLLPISDENKLGVEMQKELEKELKLSTNADAIAYVRELGGGVARRARSHLPKGIRVKFKVIDDDKTVNAFAIPGGTIYVYTGLLKKADNSAEVSAVLGHEVAHVTNRHVAQRLVAANGLAAITALALGQDPGLMGQVIGAVVNGGALLKYSRDQEREADTFGITYTNAAGYDPMGFVTFFGKLRTGAPEWTAVVNSHPAPEERMAAARERIRKMTRRSKNLGTEAHATLKSKL
jgi:predicted Zn-dependent protease